jgi:WD repeat-containing protein 23
MSSPPSAPSGGDRRNDSHQQGSGSTWHPARAWLEEEEEDEEDDDMDFEPESEVSEDRFDEEEYPDPGDEEPGGPFGMNNLFLTEFTFVDFLVSLY